mgnify:CR=1 FL=1
MSKKLKPKPIGVKHGDIIKCGPFTGRVRISGRGEGRRFTIVATSEVEIQLNPIDNQSSTVDDITN